MNIRPLSSDGSPVFLPPTGPKIPDRTGEVPRVLKRLKTLIGTHYESSVRSGYPLETIDLRAVVSALLAESRGEDPTPHLDTGNEITTYFRRALYDELLEEPSNILFTTKVSEDVVRYEAMPVDFWRECLEALAVDLDSSP
jgi:hypothetical protein